MKLALLSFLSMSMVFALLGCQSDRKKPADAKQDLSVSGEKWKRSDPNKETKGAPLNVLSFAIKNSSGTHAYQRIEVKVDYRSKDGKSLGSESLTVPKIVQPGAIILVGNIQGGLANPLTEKAVISVVRADEAK